MNKREKRMLVVTGVVVLAGAIYFLARSGGKEAHAARTDEAGAAAKPASPPAAASGSAPQKKEPSGPPVALTVERTQLERVLELAEKAPSEPARSGDPFHEFVAPATAPEAAKAPGVKDLPQLGGTFCSKKARGALLDGEVCFQGQTHSGFLLLKVDADAVRLSRDGREFVVRYDPLAPPAAKKKEAK